MAEQSAMGATGPAGNAAILVLSCDKYSDLWAPFFTSFFKAWPDVPFRVCLLANEKTCEDPRVDTLLSGPDRDWASSLKRAIEQIEEPYVFFMIEDAFLDQPVDTAKVLELFQRAVSIDATYLRLRPSPPPDLPHDDLVGRIHPEALYRTSLFVSFWKRDYILDLLEDGESAWHFELTGHERTKADPAFFSTWKPVFSYIHGVEKGLWHRAAARRMQKLGFEIDLDSRKQMSRRDALLWHLSSAKGHILNLFPSETRPRILKAANRFYRLIGYRS